MLNSKTAMLAPSHLRFHKLRSIVDDYLAQVDADEKRRIEASLKNAADQARTKSKKTAQPQGSEFEGYCRFLSGEGARIWDEFVREISQANLRRDFAPLGKTEADQLQEALDKSWRHSLTTNGLTDNNGHANPPKQEENVRFHERVTRWFKDDGKQYLKQCFSPIRTTFGFFFGSHEALSEHGQAQIGRFRIAVWLIALGFSVIALTFYYIPEIARRFADFRFGTNLTAFNDTTKIVTEFQGSKEWKSLLVHVREATSDVKRAQQELETASKQTSEAWALLSANQKTLQEIKTCFDEQSAIVQQFLMTRKKDDKDVPLFASLLQDTVDAIRGLKTSDEAVKASATFLAQLDGVKVGELDSKATIEQAKGFARFYVDGVLKSAVVSSGAGDFTQRRSALDSTLVELSKKAGEMASLAENLKNPDSGLTGDVKKFASVESALSAALSSDRLEKLEKSWSKAQDSLAIVEKTIATGHTPDKKGATLYDNAEKSLDQINKAAERINSLVETFERLSHQGAAPGIILLFAIGGMFVTFGVTSLRAWIKGVEFRRDQVEWDRKIRMFSELSAGFLARGIDPSRALGTIHGLTRNEESKPQLAAETPITITLSELLSTFKAK